MMKRPAGESTGSSTPSFLEATVREDPQRYRLTACRPPSLLSRLRPQTVWEYVVPSLRHRKPTQKLRTICLNNAFSKLYEALFVLSLVGRAVGSCSTIFVILVIRVAPRRNIVENTLTSCRLQNMSVRLFNTRTWSYMYNG